MKSQVYRYTFDQSLDINEVEATVNLAVLATESLHGESRVRLEAPYRFDAQTRTCEIAASGEVGTDLARLFFGFISREFDGDRYRVERYEHTDLVAVGTD